MVDLRAATKRREGCKGEKERKGRRGRGKGREEGKARVAACKACGLRPSYYPYGYPMMYASEEKVKGRDEGKHGHMARGGHGLLQVSLGPTMPYPSTPCGQPPLKRPHGRLRGGCLQGKWPVAVLLPPWIPHDVRLRGGREGKGEKRERKGKGGGEAWVYGEGWPLTPSIIVS
jgi:hypothetical protein